LTASNNRGIEEEINNEGMKIDEDTTIKWVGNPVLRGVIVTSKNQVKIRGRKRKEKCSRNSFLFIC